MPTTRMEAVRLPAVPQELLEAIEKLDVEPIRRLRQRVVGNEVLSVQDTLPIIDLMIEKMRPLAPEHMAEVTDIRSRVSTAEGERPLLTLMSVVENTILDTQDEHLRQTSPAAWTLRRLLSGGLNQSERMYTLPACVAAAVQTRRPELLKQAFNQIEAGQFFSRAEMKEMTDLVRDYTETRIGGGIATGLEFGSDVEVNETSCTQLLKTIEVIIDDLAFNDSQTGGLYFGDGQGRNRSLHRALS